jgi:hypothetical protein
MVVQAASLSPELPKASANTLSDEAAFQFSDGTKDRENHPVFLRWRLPRGAGAKAFLAPYE